jgi:hypothetical protein
MVTQSGLNDKPLSKINYSLMKKIASIIIVVTVAALVSLSFASTEKPVNSKKERARASHAAVQTEVGFVAEQVAR